MPPTPKPKPPPLTHFLCIPLITPASRSQLTQTLNTFRADALSKTKYPDLTDGLLPERAIRPLGTLHLTLGVMSLGTEEKVEGALKLLKEIDFKALLSVPSVVKFASSGGKGAGKGKQTLTTIATPNPNPGSEKSPSSTAPPITNPESEQTSTQPQPPTSPLNQEQTLPPKNLTITLQSLQAMQSPKNTSILYTSPLDTDLRLYTLASTLRSLFITQSYILNPTHKLLLHATLLNTIYARGVKKGGTGHGKKSKARLSIDARELIEAWEGRDFIREVRVERIAICRMGAQVGEDGEEAYVVEGEVEIPDFGL